MVIVDITILLTGYGGSSTDSDTMEFNVQTISTQQHGEALADGEGNVLYFFTPDTERGDNKGVSIGPEPGAWPVHQTDTEAASRLCLGRSIMISRSR